MFPPFLLLLATAALGREHLEEAKGQLKVETVSWQGKRLQTSLQILPEDEDTPHVTRDEAASPMGRSLRERTSKLEALWDRPAYRMRRFNLTAEPGEHPCWAGFKSMMRDTDRCKGWQRSYVPKGQKQSFYNTGASRSSNFTLEDVVADQINVWLEENSTDVHRDVAVKAAEIYTNALGAVELKPTEDTASWMEQECKVMGQMPFMYSCSNKINVLVQFCMAPSAGYPRDQLPTFPADPMMSFMPFMPEATPQQLMAKALMDLYNRIPPQHGVRLTHLLANLSQKGGKLSQSDHVMLSHVIRILEETVERDVQKLTQHDTESTEFATPTASSLVEIDEDHAGSSPRYAPSMASLTSSTSTSSPLHAVEDSRLGPVFML